MDKRTIKITSIEMAEEIKGIYRLSWIDLPEVGDDVVIQSAETSEKKRGVVTAVDTRAHTFDVKIEE